MTSRMNFKNGGSTRQVAYACKGATLRVMVASRPKVRFCPDVSMDGSLYNVKFLYTFFFFILCIVSLGRYSSLADSDHEVFFFFFFFVYSQLKT
jgi:hypothetical protein